MATVTTQTEFKNAVTNLDPDILVANDITLTSPTTIRHAVTIKGETGVSLFWGSPTAANPNMLIVDAAGELVIESLTLDAENRNGTLVHVNGGSFTMNDGVVLKNIRSTTANGAVKVGGLTSTAGGTFIMNGGLITGIDTSDAVFCAGGTVIMNNDATITDNLAAGISITRTVTGRIRAKLTMTGNALVSNNRSKDAGGAGKIYGSDMIMGVNEGDAPVITGNQTPYYAGGLVFVEDSSLIMRYGAEISDNHATQFGGGVVAQDTVISMRDDATIKNNKGDIGAGGLMISTNSAAALEERVKIAGNTSSGRGGGIYVQSGAILQLKGTASVSDNTAENGAGVYLNASSALIGSDDSSPQIHRNKASGLGGGVFISADSRLDLMGQASIADNAATEGNGIYKLGALNVSQSPTVSDGLFFDDTQTTGFSGIPSARPDGAPMAEESSIQVEDFLLGLAGRVVFAETYNENVYKEKISRAFFAASEPVHSDNVPIIADALTEEAGIQLESSGYVSVRNVPLVIADKGEEYERLQEPDRAAWKIPREFGLGYAVILNAELNQVLIDYAVYSITYHELFGAENPNPGSYRISDLPITLSDPGPRPGHTFTGWCDGEGKTVTEIPVGTAGNISLTAVWEKIILHITFDANARCVCNVPETITAHYGEKVKLPSSVPCRPDYRFVCWNMPSSGSGKVYFPGDTIVISDVSIALHAQWQPLCCCCNERDGHSGDSRIPTKCVVSLE